MHDHAFAPPRDTNAGTRVRTAELLGALSTALDLTEGLLPGHAARTCWLSMRLAEAIGLPDADREALFYAALLKDAGCSSNAAALTQLFGGDERSLKAMQAASGRSTVAMAILSIRAMSAVEPLPRRVRRLIHLALNGRRERAAVEHLRCERGAQIAMNAGFPPSVAEAVQSLHEHWDGRGLPEGRTGRSIPLFSRIVALCAGVDVFVTARGPRHAMRIIRGRARTWYDPELVEVVLELAADGLLLELTDGEAERRIGEMEPHGHVRSSDARDIDRIATAFADIVDAKSPFTGSHSRNVSRLAGAAARRIGLTEASARDVARAGLLHDLGKLGVPNSILDKPGRLTADEYLAIRRHPELSLRILEPVGIFKRVAELAASHHERLDGTGYPRGLHAEELALEARIVAAADVYEALTADRPYRPSMPPEAAFGVMTGMVGDHLAVDAVQALHDAVASSAWGSPAPFMKREHAAVR